MSNDRNLTDLVAITSPLTSDWIYTVRPGSPNLPRKIRAGDFLGNFSSALWFNVKAPAYGATGDGTTNDQPAIQLALDAANVAGGGIVFFPVGDYRLVTNILTVYSNTTLMGTGYGSRIFCTSLNLTKIDSESTHYGTFMSSLVYATDSAENVKIHNLRVSGAFVSGVGSYTHSVFFGQNTVNCAIDGCWISGAGWAGIWFTGSGHKVHDNWFSTCGINGVEANATFHCDIVNNWIDDCGIDNVTPGVAGIEFNANTEDLLIHGNHILRGGSGIFSQQQGGDNIIITNNVMFQVGGRGIDIEAAAALGYKNVIISGNIIRDTTASNAFAHGIRLCNDISQFVIVNNIITGLDNGAPSAIILNGTSAEIVCRGVIAHNVCDGNWVNIEIADYSDNISVHNNRFSNALGTNVGLSVNATNISWRNNIGYITRNFGATSVADGGTVSHGCNVTPTRVNATPSTSGEMVSVTAIAATTFTVAIKKHDGTAGTTAVVYWEAEKT